MQKWIRSSNFLRVSTFLCSTLYIRNYSNRLPTTYLGSKNTHSRWWQCWTLDFIDSRSNRHLILPSAEAFRNSERRRLQNTWIPHSTPKEKYHEHRNHQCPLRKRTREIIEHKAVYDGITTSTTCQVSQRPSTELWSSAHVRWKQAEAGLILLTIVFEWNLILRRSSPGNSPKNLPRIFTKIELSSRISQWKVNTTPGASALTRRSLYSHTNENKTFFQFKHFFKLCTFQYVESSSSVFIKLVKAGHSYSQLQTKTET